MGYKKIKIALPIIIGSASICLAYAQQSELDFLSKKQPSQERQNQVSGVNNQNSPSEQSAPLSELDILSQSTQNDPFDDITQNVSREPVSVTLRALDKIIARTIDIEVPINSLATFGTLEIVPRFCDKRPPEDFPETTAFLEIFDTLSLNDNDPKKTDDIAAQTTSNESPAPPAPTGKPVVLAEPTKGPKTEGERIFTGWMFASSPGLNALEHTVYDVWVIDCKTRLVENEEE